MFQKDIPLEKSLVKDFFFLFVFSHLSPVNTNTYMSSTYALHILSFEKYPCALLFNNHLLGNIIYIVMEPTNLKFEFLLIYSHTMIPVSISHEPLRIIK